MASLLEFSLTELARKKKKNTGKYSTFTEDCWESSQTGEGTVLPASF